MNGAWHRHFDARTEREFVRIRRECSAKRQETEPLRGVRNCILAVLILIFVSPHVTFWPPVAASQLVAKLSKLAPPASAAVGSCAVLSHQAVGMTISSRNGHFLGVAVLCRSKRRC
jgi:hypothetical protein